MELFLVRVFFSVQWLSYIISNELVKPLTKSKYIGKIIYNWPSPDILKAIVNLIETIVEIGHCHIITNICPSNPYCENSSLAIGIVLLVSVISILLMLCCANEVCSPLKIMKKRRRLLVSLPGTTIRSRRSFIKNIRL